MTIEQIHAHKEKFSKNWNNSGSTWQTNTAAMEMKTVLLALLREHGVFTFDLTQAVTHDENGVDADEPTIIEPETGEVIDITAREIDPDEIADPDRPANEEDWAKFYAKFQNHFSIEELASVQKQTNNAMIAYDRMMEQHP